MPRRVAGRCHAGAVDLYDLLAESGHVASRADLVAALGRHRVDNAIKSGQIAAVFPRTYAAPWNLDQPDVQRRAALLSVGGQAALSHLTALERYDLPVPTATRSTSPRTTPGTRGASRDSSSSTGRSCRWTPASSTGCR